MKRGFRLTRSTDIKRVRRFGKSYAHPLVVLVAQPNQTAFTRVAVIAGAAVGGAVTRNLVKRRLRACMNEAHPHLAPGWDLLVIARKLAAEAQSTQIQTAIYRLLTQASLLNSKLQDSCD